MTVCPWLTMFILLEGKKAIRLKVIRAIFSWRKHTNKAVFFLTFWNPCLLTSIIECDIWSTCALHFLCIFSQTDLYIKVFFLQKRVHTILSHFLPSLFWSSLLAYFQMQQREHLKFPTVILDDYWLLLGCFPLSKEFSEDERVRTVEAR